MAAIMRSLRIAFDIVAVTVRRRNGGALDEVLAVRLVDIRNRAVAVLAALIKL